MFQLTTWVDKDGELTLKGRQASQVLVCAYLLCLVLLCWTPQYGLVEGVETPGIQHFGRVVVLLIPFNSLINLGQVTSLLQLIKVFVQNIANIFLLSPLVFQLLWLWPWLGTRKRVLCFSLGMSLWIELSQIVLDLLFDFNRVFEIDDLWTNTLGSYLAYLCFKWLQASISKDNLS